MIKILFGVALGITAATLLPEFTRPLFDLGSAALQKLF